MILLSIDPSSTRSGYAVLDVRGWLSVSVIEAGYLKPVRASHPPLMRIRAMADDLDELVALHSPAACTIEQTTGKVGKKRHKGGGAGLSIYGEAIGYLLARLDALMTADRVWPINENVWTHGVSKDDRVALLAARYPAYAAHMGMDKGGDVADAIGLGEFWAMEHWTEEAA